MQEQGRVAVVIVNFNGAAHVAECLEALRSQSFRDFFAVVLDNGSSDGSAELIATGFPEVELDRSPDNLGFAAGNNRAIESCLERDGLEYVLTLNNDVVLEADCVEKMVEALDARPDAWSCQPKMLLLEERDGRLLLNNTGTLVWRDGSAFHRGINEPDAGQYDEATDIFGTCAGCSLYRATALLETGLFDEGFFAYLEDVDLSWRGRLLGYRSLLVSEARCSHHHGASATDPAWKIALVEANRVRVLVKNYPVSDIILSPAFTAYRMARLVLQGVSGPEGGSRLESYRGGLGPCAMLRAVARGWASGLKALPLCLRQRRSFNEKRVLGAPERRRLVSVYTAPLGALISR